MATTTTLNLIKPARSDGFKISDFNANSDIIDQAFTACKADLTNRGFIGNVKSIAGTDLNDLLATGFYGGNNLTNAPISSTNYFYIEVVSYNGNNLVKQRATVVTGTDTGLIFERVKNTNWTPWYKIATNKQLIDVEDALIAHKAEHAKYADFRRTTHQSIPDNTNTQVFFQTKNSYNDENFCEIDESTGQIKILERGIYEISAYIGFQLNANGYRSVQLVGAINRVPSIGASVPTAITTNTFVEQNANSLVSIIVTQTSGGALDILSNAILVKIRQVSKLD